MFTTEAQMEKINGREYKVDVMETGVNTKANLLKNGWDGLNYMLTGKRGAAHLAFRSARTGEFKIVTTLRF